MRVLENCGKMEIRESPIEGFGVFAKEDIAAGTLLEETPIILFPRYVNFAKNIFDFLKGSGWISQKEIFMENLRANHNFKDPERYYFKWHPPVSLDGDSMFTVLPLGCGPIYNTSNTNNNADWKMLKDTFTFRAERDIRKNEEILTFYGYFVSEDGSTFNCETVFHMAIDIFPSATGQNHKVKVLRFGSIETLNTQRSNPAAHKIHTLLAQSIDGMLIKRVQLMQAGGEVIHVFDVPPSLSLTLLYRRLSEIRAHPAPIVQFTFEYVNKTTNQLTTEEVVWKK